MNTRLIAQRLPAIAAALVLAPPSADATVLIFEPVQANYQPLDQSYGDRVTGTSQDGFVYGPVGGFTPNVEVDYGVLPHAVLQLFRYGYGDLKDVLFDASSGFGHLEVALAADEGWVVELDGFDLAAWNAVDPINSVQIWNGDGDMLFDERDVAISDSSRTTFAFDPPLAAETIVIGFDSGNLIGRSNYIAIDNIQYGQAEASVPTETVSWGVLKAWSR